MPIFTGQGALKIQSSKAQLTTAWTSNLNAAQGWYRLVK